MPDDAVFVDTGVFIAWVNPRDRHHTSAQELVRAMKEGRWSRIETNDQVLAETLNWLRARIPDPTAARLVLRLVFGDARIEGLVSAVHRTDAAAYERALTDYFRYADQGLSFTDCTVLGAMADRKVGTLGTFDTGFRGCVADIVPGPGGDDRTPA